MRTFSQKARKEGKRIGLVPTMGALHAGHLSLMDYTRSECDLLVASIFVNPLQFDREDDLAGYPRTFEKDLELCTAHGVDVVFAPRPENMYPDGFQTSVSVGDMTKGLCGAGRTGHFQGVTTVVMKLFNTVLSDIAVFGEKDFQQLKVIQRMVRDLDMLVEVVGRPTVRENDGLALSSRNKHLSPEERKKALCLSRALDRACSLAAEGVVDSPTLIAKASEEIQKTNGAKMEYLEIVDSDSLKPLDKITKPARMCLAVWLGETRLIDNASLN
jgi:pantoate--beta-alanine ligase